jgi:acyl carrier protein
MSLDTARVKEFETLWMEVLGVDAVEQHDDFFDLGGHSLSALRLSTLLREELNLDIELQQVLDNPVYEDLLAIAHQAAAARAVEGVL